MKEKFDLKVDLVEKKHAPLSSFFCSNALGLAYLRIPKSGCTTIEAWMAKQHPEYSPKKPFRLHSPDVSQKYFDQVITNENKCGQNLRFTFVRHPIRRLESFYRDKVSGAKHKKFIFDNLNQFGIEYGMPYVEMVRNLVKVKTPWLLNPHVAPQRCFLFRDDKLRVDLICRLEQFDFYMKKLCQLTGAPFSATALNKSKPTSEDLKLSERDLQSLYRFFARDFQFLGYPIE